MMAGMDDKEAKRRLDWLLTSDFLAIDEMGKEKRKTKNGSLFVNVQMERILKQRYDDSMPVLLATNMDHGALAGSYGSTVMSIIDGKYQTVAMEPGDCRKKMAEKMTKDMKY